MLLAAPTAAHAAAGVETVYTSADEVTAGMWGSCAPVTYSVQGGVREDRWAVARAISQLETATGQLYVEVPPAAASLSVIIWPDVADSRYLQLDGTGPDGRPTDKGYTAPDGNSIDFLDGYVSQALVMHELMLSRHLIEHDDPGGLLGHFVDPHTDRYSAPDTAMLQTTACAGV